MPPRDKNKPGLHAPQGEAGRAFFLCAHGAAQLLSHPRCRPFELRRSCHLGSRPPLGRLPAPAHARKKKSSEHGPLYKASLLCGLAPLVTGSSIFALWYATRADVFVTLGLFTIASGVCLAGIGFLCLTLHLVRRRRRGDAWPALLKQGALPSGVLLANIPACLLISGLALHLLTSYAVTLHNKSAVAIDRFVLSGPGVYEEWEGVPAGASRSARMAFTHDGALAFEAAVGTRRYDGTVEAYVTRGSGGAATVVYTPDGSFSVHSRTERLSD